MKKGNKKSISTSAVQVFSAQLRASQPLPSEAQRAIFQLAQTAGLVDLTTLLVKREDAPSDLVEKYKKILDIPVRVAFLTRNNHSEEFLKEEIRSESRASVLAALVHARPPKAVLDLVCLSFKEKPTRSLAEALCNYTAPARAQASMHSLLDVETSLLILETLSGRFSSLTQNTQNSLQAIVSKLVESKDLDLLNRAAQKNQSPELVSFFLPLGISAKSQIDLLEVIAASLADTAKSQNWARRQAYHQAGAALETLLNLNLEEEVLSHIESLLEKGLFTDKKYSLLLQEKRGLRGAVDLKELIKKGRNRDEDAILAVILSQEADLLVRLEFTNLLRDVNRLQPFVTSLPDEVKDALFHKNPRMLSMYKDLSCYENPEEALLRILNKSIEEFLRSGRQMYYGSTTLAVLATMDLKEEHIKKLPWSFLQALTSQSYYYGSSYESLLVKLSTLQVKTFKEDALLWETFGIISDEFSGTVGELLETVALLETA